MSLGSANVDQSESGIKVGVAMYWQIQGCHRHVPPTGSNSFVFAYIFAEKCSCQKSAPQRGKSWIHHCNGLLGGGGAFFRFPHGNPGSERVVFLSILIIYVYIYMECISPFETSQTHQGWIQDLIGGPDRNRPKLPTVCSSVM